MQLCWITELGSQVVSPEKAPEFAARDDGVLWGHAEHPDEAGMALLQELVAVRAQDLKTCHTQSPVPALHAYPDHFFTR